MAFAPAHSAPPPLTVEIIQLDHGLGLPLPSHGTAQSAGLDLYAAVADDLILEPGQRQAIPTGIAIALPEGYEGQIRSRSGLAARHGVVVFNAPGTIDADYRGEVLVLLMNHGNTPFVVNRGLRLAQLVVAAHSRLTWIPCSTFSQNTDRGNGGFGSTGFRGKPIAP